MRYWRIGRHGLLGGVGIVDAEGGLVEVVGRRGRLSPRGRICRLEVAYPRRYYVSLNSMSSSPLETSRSGRARIEREKGGQVYTFRMRSSADCQRQARLLQLQPPSVLGSLFLPALQSAIFGRFAIVARDALSSPRSIAFLVSHQSTITRKHTHVLPHKAQPP